MHIDYGNYGKVGANSRFYNNATRKVPGQSPLLEVQEAKPPQAESGLGFRCEWMGKIYLF